MTCYDMMEDGICIASTFILRMAMSCDALTVTLNMYSTVGRQ